ncbi:MAG: hypothetical protein QOD37_2218, partial [Gaiellales bacterium]|nr:hypothetical protein [Gaiellales bacterium]
FPILAFTSGLLLAFALVEPRISVRPSADVDAVAEVEDAEHIASPAVAGR